MARRVGDGTRRATFEIKCEFFRKESTLMNLLKEIKKLKLKIGQYVVVGGSALAGYGIRKSDDIDILVIPEI